MRRTGLLGLGWLSDEPPRAQLRERVSVAHSRKPGDSPATHRHDHLAASSGVVHVPAQLIVQLTDTNLGLRRCLM